MLLHPEAEREFERLVALDRDTRFDLGEHCRRLERLRETPTTRMPRAVRVSGESAPYQFYGARVQLFVACDARVLLLVLLEAIGSEHAQREALERAIERMGEHFDGGT